jgi:hypothetical protein
MREVGPIVWDAVPVPIGKCLAWATSDPRWVRKTFVGGVVLLLSLLVVPLPFLVGYYARVTRAALSLESLPNWNRWPDLYVEGLSVLAISVVHVVPVVVALWLLLRRAAGEPTGPATVLPFIVFVPFLLLWGLYVQVARLRAVALRRFRVAFQVSENVDFVRRNWGNIGRLVVVLAIAGVANQMGPFLCCVGMFPVSFWATSTFLYAFGRVGRCDHSLLKEWQSAG